PWTRRPSGWWPSAPLWSTPSTTSPSCTPPKGTSSASSSVPATPIRRQVAERRSRLLEQRVEPREQRLAPDQHPGAAASPCERRRDGWHLSRFNGRDHREGHRPFSPNSSFRRATKRSWLSSLVGSQWTRSYGSRVKTWIS